MQGGRIDFMSKKKFYFEGEKKDKLFLVSQKGKTNHSHLEHRPKRFQPTEHELRKYTKRKAVSCHSSPRSLTGVCY